MNPPAARHPPTPLGATERMAQARAASRDVRYELSLYVVGMTERSSQAISAIKSLCDTHLPDRYSLEVINLAESPALARAEQIVATPTLVKRQPLPLRRLVGNLSNTDRVLLALGLAP